MSGVIRLWVEGDDPGVIVVDVDPPLGAHEVEIPTDDLQEVSVPRSFTPKIDGDTLIRALEVERLIASRARNR